MKAQFSAALGLFLLVNAAAFAQPEDKTTWRLRTEGNSAALAYGTDNAEDIRIVFNCRRGSGVVKVFISETSEALKAGRSATASLTAGRVTVRVPGRMMVNEEAGVPSFDGTLPASDPLFAALPAAATLAMAVGSWRGEVIPLRELGSKAGTFNGQCRKK
jgi:hypothetical protein